MHYLPCMFDVFTRGQKIVYIKTEINKEKYISYARSIPRQPRKVLADTLAKTEKRSVIVVFMIDCQFLFSPRVDLPQG